MKDSGVKWIGEVPEDWNVQKVGNYFNQLKNKNVELEEQNLLSLSYGNIIRRDIKTSEGLLPDNFSNYNITQKNNIVLRMTDLQNDHKSLRVGFVNEKGIITSAYITIKKKNELEVNEKFIYFQLHAFDTIKGFYSMGSGVRQNVTFDHIKKLDITLPSYRKQYKIVSYLENTLSKIDNLIKETQQSIEELKKYKQSLITEAVTNGLDKNVEMKASGVEWIGDIPDNWLLTKLGSITNKIGSGKTPRGGENVYSQKGILFLRSQNIYNEGLRLEEPRFITKETHQEMSNSSVEYGDVLLNITGGSIGRTTVYNLDSEANVNQHVCILRAKKALVLSKWIHFCLISSLGEQSVRYFQTGGNREGLNFGDISKVLIPLPTINQQKIIINELTRKENVINSMVIDKKVIVLELEQYKKSLIYEYVTGKKEV